MKDINCHPFAIKDVVAAAVTLWLKEEDKESSAWLLYDEIPVVGSNLSGYHSRGPFR